jgi:hypothetical protein
MMSSNDPDDLDRIDHEIRLNELKHQAEELAGGPVHAWEADDCPPGVAEQFWQNIVAYEKAPWTSHFQQLLEAGVELPAPNEMDDAALSAKLWELIRALAAMRVFLSDTDHLSDRELYTHLWEETLHEAIKDVPCDGSSAWHIDLLGSGSEQDTFLYLKHFADEDWRRHWAEQFPEDEIPEHVDPPYDRDRHLPQPA